MYSARPQSSHPSDDGSVFESVVVMYPSTVQEESRWTKIPVRTVMSIGCFLTTKLGETLACAGLVYFVSYDHPCPRVLGSLRANHDRLLGCKIENDEQFCLFSY